MYLGMPKSCRLHETYVYVEPYLVPFVIGVFGTALKGIRKVVETFQLKGIVASVYCSLS